MRKSVHSEKEHLEGHPKEEVRVEPTLSLGKARKFKIYPSKGKFMAKEAPAGERVSLNRVYLLIKAK